MNRFILILGRAGFAVIVTDDSLQDLQDFYSYESNYLDMPQVSPKVTEVLEYNSENLLYAEKTIEQISEGPYTSEEMYECFSKYKNPLHWKLAHSVTLEDTEELLLLVASIKFYLNRQPSIEEENNKIKVTWQSSEAT